MGGVLLIMIQIINQNTNQDTNKCNQKTKWGVLDRFSQNGSVDDDETMIETMKIIRNSENSGWSHFGRNVKATLKKFLHR